MAEQETQFKAEDAIRESLAAGAAVVGVVAERLVPKKVIRQIWKRHIVAPIVKRVVK